MIENSFRELDLVVRDILEEVTESDLQMIRHQIGIDLGQLRQQINHDFNVTSIQFSSFLLSLEKEAS